MIGFVMVGTNDHDKANTFYDALLETIKLKRVGANERYLAYAPKNNPKSIEFYVTIPFDKAEASFGNGTQISFYVESKEEVDAFYKIALSLGAKDEGAPGERYEGEYYSYVRDLDGNKLCCYTFFKSVNK